MLSPPNGFPFAIYCRNVKKIVFPSYFFEENDNVKYNIYPIVKRGQLAHATSKPSKKVKLPICWDRICIFF